MWLKNLYVYRLSAPWSMTSEKLVELLTPQAFQPSNSAEMESQGWIPPREHGTLVHAVNGQMLLSLGMEKKLLPSSVINQFAKVRCSELEEQQGFKPGRKQAKEIKELVTDELLPRAFSIASSIKVWIDPVNGWLVVDTATASKAEMVLKSLLKVIDKFPVEGLRVATSPAGAMTGWLAADEAPSGFSIDQDTELRSAGEDKAAVRYVSHTLDVDDMGRHIAAGKQCTRLAMTWADRISFVLTKDLMIKRVTPLDVLKESADGSMKNDDDRFDADMTLMTGELNRLLSDVVEALGGPVELAKAA